MLPLRRPTPLALALALALGGLACTQEAPAPTPAPAAAPQDATDKAILEAQALASAGQRVEAYQRYVTILGTLPRSDPRRAPLEEATERLGFILGVPSAESVLTHNLPPGQVDPARSQALQDARALYTTGTEAMAKGEYQAALEAFQGILKAVTPEEDPELYWNAYSRVDDLSPQGEEEAEAAAATPPAQIDPELLPYLQGDEEDQDAESRARSAFMRGQSLMARGQYIDARGAFKVVLGSISPAVDPELYRAAEDNLKNVEAQLKILRGAPP